MLNALHYSHQLLNALIIKFKNGIFIDGTIGNGHDIHRIVSHDQFEGHVYGFDIQDAAMEATHLKLVDENPMNYTLVQDTHANLHNYLKKDEPIHGAIFNLGYLPGGDHQITTQADQTLTAIQAILERLEKEGQIILVVYSGHPSGKEESAQLLQQLSLIPQETFQVLTYQFINQKNSPPYLIVIERK
ncbi:class I SAM-dependent methyltransferase [Aerococcaceae bacterium DSM 111020]|nr:class I SAM-dependent methyltransferase [Aerococcaceae bacterium DSM 111020]